MGGLMSCRYEVVCTDAVGRIRTVAVWAVGPGRVAVAAPPGEGFTITEEQTRQLCLALREAHRDAAPEGLR